MRYIRLEALSIELYGFEFENKEREAQNNKVNVRLKKMGYDLVYILHFRPALAVKFAEEFLSLGSDSFFTLMYNHRELIMRQMSKTFLYKILIIIK